MADLTRHELHRWPLRRDVGEAIPPHAYFFVSALFHYLGPAFAVLLFAHLSALGVYWLRVATAALIFAVWRRPWRRLHEWDWPRRRTLLALGAVLGVMNATFYLAIARLPLGTVGAIEFVGPITLAAIGVRGRRNLLALALAVAGVVALADVRLAGEPLGFAFAFANCALFALYILLGHRVAQDAGSRVDSLAAAMLIALVTATPIGLLDALPALTRPKLLLVGIGVGLCSSVIPYLCDQLAMARLPRTTFSLLLSLLPAFATLIGLVVLRQWPEPVEIAGMALIVVAVALGGEPDSHRRGAEKPATSADSTDEKQNSGMVTAYEREPGS